MQRLALTAVFGYSYIMEAPEVQLQVARDIPGILVVQRQIRSE